MCSQEVLPRKPRLTLAHASRTSAQVISGFDGYMERSASSGSEYSGRDGISATVTYALADPRGVAEQSATTIATRFSTISMHTFSTEAPHHSPSSGRLQLRCGLARPGGRTGEALPLRYVKTASISAGPVSSMPSTPRSAPGQERFGLLVDGEYYGPFAQVRVAPCVVPGEAEPLTLPICTIFPVGCPND